MVEALAPQAPLPVLDSRSVEGLELRLKADVVVVGSGAGGGVVAYELARTGRSVVVVEAGAYVPSSAFTETLDGMFDRVYQDAGGQMNTDGDLMVLQGRCVGGSTVVNGAVCFRIPPRVLEKWQKAHGLVDHTAERMSAMYAVMEKRLSVHVNAPHEINANSAALVRGCEKLGWHHAPLARNVKDCALTGFCFHGCASDRKQSALVTHLPWAVAHGARIVAETQIERVRLVDGRAVGVEGTLRRGASGETVARVVVDAERVVVAAGAIQSPLLLQRSEVPDPHGHVGRHLALHPSALVVGRFPERLDAWRGATVGAACHAFDEDERGGFLLEGGMASPDTLSMMLPSYGSAFVEGMRHYRHLASVACLIHDENVGRVHAEGGTKKIEYRLADSDRARMLEAMRAAARIYFAAGATQVYLPTHGPGVVEGEAALDAALAALPLGPHAVKMISYHPQGTCRMGADPEASVVSPSGELHRVRGLYVADASLFPTSILVNPQMTVYALAGLIAQGLKTA
jgi:choline dehydrogenase-like flavoprotein